MQSSFDIGHGLNLTIAADGRWFVAGAKGSWPIETSGDYYRVVTLLEKDYSEVKEATDRMRAEKPNAQPFLLEMVVKIGLQSDSDHWASLAMEWVKRLTDEQIKSMEDELGKVSTAKWASQGLRQAAKKNLKSAATRHIAS